MLSTALTALIRLNRIVKISNIEKPLLLYLSGPVKKHWAGAVRFCEIQTMATDEEINDPKRHLNFNQLIERKDKEHVFVIDVREPSEIEETGSIPGSINIPLNDLCHALIEVSNEEFLKLYHSPKPRIEDEIIFSCRSGKRSAKAMKIALDLGFKRAKSYDGGWTDWASKTEAC